MYQHSDIADVKAQMNRRILILLAPALALTALVVISFIRRVEWLTASLFALLGCVLLFAISLYIMPLKRYQRYLRHAIDGRQRRSVLSFQSCDRESVMREGVAFYPCCSRRGTRKDEMDDRRLYWDSNLPLPVWQKGDKLVLFSHEKAISRWEKAGLDEALDG